jgi:hypothetical protein
MFPDAFALTGLTDWRRRKLLDRAYSIQHVGRVGFAFEAIPHMLQQLASVASLGHVLETV